MGRRSPSLDHVVHSSRAYRDWSMSAFGGLLDEMQHQQTDNTAGNIGQLTIHSDDLGSRLESMLPPTALGELFVGPPSTALTVRDFDSAYFKVLIFLAANNFPRLSERGMEAVLRPMQGRSCEQLEVLFHYMVGPIQMVLAENLFFHAIKVGDERMVEALLKNQALGIDVDKEISLSVNKELRYNPLVLFCKYKQAAVLRILLRYNAQINKADSTEKPLGLLGLAIEDFTNSDADIELIRQLLGARVSIRPLFFNHLPDFWDSEIPDWLLRERPHHEYRDWYENGVFHQCMLILDLEKCTWIIDLILAMRLDLNHVGNIECLRNKCPFSKSFGYRTTIIDIIARKGYIRLARKLLEFGVCLTSHTLIKAVESENMELVEYLLDYGANIDALGSGSTALAEAVRTENPQLTRILVQQGALCHIKTKLGFRAAIGAASAIGNLGVIQALLTTAKHDFARIADAFCYGLEAAIKADQEDSALLLIQSGMELTDNHLHLALSRRNMTIVRTLLDNGVEIVDRAGESTPLLESAIRWGNHAIVNELISRGTYVNRSYCEDNSPLLTAIKMQDTTLVKLLVNAGAIIDESHKAEYRRNGEEYVKECDYSVGFNTDEITALRQASRLGDTEMVRLLEYGAEPNDSVALSEAILKNSSEIVTLLLQAFWAKYPHGIEGYGSLALIIAINIEDAFRIEQIIDKVDTTAFSTFGQISDLQDYEFPLVEHFEHSQLDKVTPLGYTILIGGHQSVATARSLLKGRVDANGIVFLPKESWGPKLRKTALLLAICRANKHMIQLLLEFNADINAPGTNSFGRTPLQHAAEEGNFEVVKFLLINGAVANDVPAKWGGGTALQLAAISGYIGIVSLLLDNGADINAPPSGVDGRTALEGAAEWGRLDMVKFLLDSDFNIRSDSGRQYYGAAKYRARENEHKAIVDLLESCYSDPGPSPQAVFTDEEGWTFWGVETEDGFEAWEGEVPYVQDPRQASGEGLALMEIDTLSSQDLWMAPGDIFEG